MEGYIKQRKKSYRPNCLIRHRENRSYPIYRQSHWPALRRRGISCAAPPDPRLAGTEAIAGHEVARWNTVVHEHAREIPAVAGWRGGTDRRRV